MPARKRLRPKKKKAWISWRVLHKQLQSESKDLRVTPAASRALQQQLYAISAHLVSKVRERVSKKRRRRLTVDESDAVAVYREFIDPRNLATQLSAELLRLASVLEEQAADAAAAFQEN